MRNCAFVPESLISTCVILLSSLKNVYIFCYYSVYLFGAILSDAQVLFLALLSWIFLGQYTAPICGAEIELGSVVSARQVFKLYTISLALENI